MSQQEFDTYLSLLCRLLRIAPRQREQVAEEFRAHMEDRLDELLSSGMNREAAVKLALEEFGDAAGLAAEIASISQGRRKRWIMRIGTISVVGLAAAVLLGVALWPEGAQVKAPQAVAQTEEPSGDQPRVAGKKGAKAKAEQSVEEKLAQRMNLAESEVPLVAVLTQLSDQANLQIYINRKAIEAANIALDAPITIALEQVRLDTLLDLVLEQVGFGELAYVERDGILIISTSEALSGASEVKVYNCRDLLAMASPVQGGGMMMGPGGMEGHMMPGGGGFDRPRPSIPSLDEGSTTEPEAGIPDTSGGTSPPAERTRPKPAPPRLRNSQPTDEAAEPEIPRGIAPQFGGGGGPPTPGGGAAMGGMMPAGGMGGMMGGGGGGMASGTPRTDEEIRAERLMHLITTAVKQESWQDMGGFGTISEYKGLIVINHNARTHKEVENVLKMLREAAGLPPGGPMGRAGDMTEMMMGGPRMPGGGPTPGSFGARP